MEWGDGQQSVTHDMDFLVVDYLFPYCVILGWPMLLAFSMLPFLPYLKANFLTSTSITYRKGDQAIVKELYLKALARDTVMAIEFDLEEGNDRKAELMEEIGEIQLGHTPK